MRENTRDREVYEMKKIILVAETGSDITPELAQQYGIKMVPMHVTFGEEMFDDSC